MKTGLLAAVVAIVAGHAWAQTPAVTTTTPAPQPVQRESRVATRTGHEASVTVGGYTYIEPGTLRISLHGPRLGGEYAGAVSVTPRVFARASVRGSVARVTYDGWCLPYLIRPSSSSPNGYELGFGSASPCRHTGNPDGYLELRGVVGRDFLGRTWGVSPKTGLGFRYLSNGTPEVAGYRTDAYLFLPLDVTARTSVASHGVVSVNAAFDVLLHGWQTTRQSKLGGADVPETPEAPAFTVNGFTDLSFAQQRGFAVRAGATYDVTRRWSVGSSYIYWNVGASPVRYTTATFTVNGVTARQQIGFYEPDNVTHEWFVTLGFHF